MIKVSDNIFKYSGKIILVKQFLYITDLQLNTSYMISFYINIKKINKTIIDPFLE